MSNHNTPPPIHIHTENDLPTTNPSPTTTHESNVNRSHPHPIELVPISTNQPPNPTNIRKSARTSKPPSYLQDFHCSLISDNSNPFPPYNIGTTPYPLSNYLSYDKLSHHQRLFNLNISTTKEPSSYSYATTGLNWQQAIINELKSLNDTHTRDITTFAP